MPRGKNYVNNHQGVHLQSKVGDKSGPMMPFCEYGDGCQRPGCIYRHDELQPSSGGKNHVCIPFLTGKCTFEKGCRKRHPSKDEIPRVLARYKKIRCRFRDECYTEGCLFMHPKEERQREPNFVAPHHFPPLSSNCTSVSLSSSESNSKQAAVSDSVWKKNPHTMISDIPSNIDSSRNSQQKKDHISLQGASSPTMEQQQVEPKQPSAVWGCPNGTKGELSLETSHHPPQQPLPSIPISQEGCFNAPPPPNIPTLVPGTDPNTGYPIDPSVYYYEQQSFYYNYQEYQQMIPSYPTIASHGNLGPPMGIPFNAEAKEFIPGMFTA